MSLLGRAITLAGIAAVRAIRNRASRICIAAFVAAVAWPGVVSLTGAGGSGLFAQSFNLQSGPGTQLEQFPTPRDPAYVPPLLPQSTLDEVNSGDAGGSALIFSAGGGSDLVSLFAERRAAQLEAARRADRYGERNAQYLDETGQDRALLEQNLLRQFGSSRGLPRDFGDAHYSETPGRRFSVVFFLSLPITAGIAGGLYQLFGPGVRINGPADYPALLGVLGVGGIFSALIGYYDYTQMQELRAHRVGHRAREAYDLRNHPFGRRGAPGDDSQNRDEDRSELRNQGLSPGDSTGLRGDAARTSPDPHAIAHWRRAWRTAAAEDARRALRRAASADFRTESGGELSVRSGRSSAYEALRLRFNFAY